MDLSEAIEEGIQVANKVENVMYATLEFTSDNAVYVNFYVNEELSVNDLMRRDRIIYWLWYSKLPKELQNTLRFDSYTLPVITSFMDETITLPVGQIKKLLNINLEEI